MSDLQIKAGDTYPPLKGEAKDANGLLPVASATLLTVVLKSGSTLVTGTATAIVPPEEEIEEGVKHFWNWRYNWAKGDTDTAGTYNGELKITWSAIVNPPGGVQRVPNDGTVEVEIEPNQGG